MSDEYIDFSFCEKLTLYTGTYGKEKCVCKCPNCLLDFSREISRQCGNIDQIKLIIEKFPKLKVVNICGNPDPCVDYEFCNSIAKLLIQNGIKVSFITSGAGGIDIIKKLTHGLDYTKLRIMFSLDSLDNKTLYMLRCSKGYNLETITESLDFCHANNINSIVCATLWPININDDWNKFCEYCVNHGVSRIMFTIGSTNDNKKVITDEQIIELNNKYDEIKEIQYITKNVNQVIGKEEFGCMNKDCKKLMGYLTKDFVMITSCFALASQKKEYMCNLETGRIKVHDDKIKSCPFHNYRKSRNPQYTYLCIN